MKVVPWIVFGLSSTVLAFVLFRNKHSLQWMGQVALQIVFAAVLLYGINWIGAAYGFRLPINVMTVAAVTVLGIPGAGLLTAAKLMFV
ncbi:pro-sigmaK processing inhibitor BofA family protein [Paenibacillus senegalensis]|uniref:pro-sigmaK processing inhibitor BofA family protein n=1 Tax=Paenibacillus senegalensis TaxID=1465766 RepID=UPI0002888EA3|nr:pro-sigmaK processing inhibitor BofA family protein [Paenibacillus senegalensis]